MRTIATTTTFRFAVMHVQVSVWFYIGYAGKGNRPHFLSMSFFFAMMFVQGNCNMSNLQGNYINYLKPVFQDESPCGPACHPYDCWKVVRMLAFAYENDDDGFRCTWRRPPVCTALKVCLNLYDIEKAMHLFLLLLITHLNNERFHSSKYIKRKWYNC